jgi:TPR repeat protein
MRNFRLLFCLCLLALAATPARSAPGPQNDARIALVIANANYPSAAAPLPNALKDASSIAEEFRRLKFTVDLKNNLGKEDMQKAIEAFTGRIKKGTIALFYFSGFGLQVSRQSYLLPVDASIWTQADVRRDGVGVDALLKKMQRNDAGAKIIIIDAAHRNPFERRIRTVAAGLAPLETPAGTLVLYSSALGKMVDEKKSGGNSLFASELVKELHATSLSAEDIFNRARIGVSRASAGEQVPWVASSLLSEIYFAGHPSAPLAASDASLSATIGVESQTADTAVQDAPVKPVAAPSRPPVQHRAAPAPAPSEPLRMTVTVKVGESPEKRGLLGVRVAGLNVDIARILGLASAHGAFVTSVSPHGPAALAGIAPADVIVDFDGHGISRWSDLLLVAGATPPGSSARATLIRLARSPTELADRLQRRAEQGDDDAAYGVAWLYWSDNNLLRDDAVAARWALQAAGHGNARALNLLGHLYAGGRGVTQDVAQAADLFRKAADRGDANAMYALARMYASGTGVGKNLTEAAHWYQKAADGGHSPAMVALGQLYANGNGVAKDSAEAVAWYRKATTENNPAAMSYLGWMYETGQGVAQDYAQASQWYHKAADLNHSGGMYRLGVMAEAGRGRPKNDAEAVSWYRKAVNRDHPYAMVALGLMYENGRGVEHNPAEALRLFRQAGDKGNAVGLFYVGLSYERSKDYEKSSRYYAAAARLGNTPAMHNLAIAYDRGRGVEQNRRLAAEWMIKSIKAGSKFSLTQMTQNPGAYSTQFRKELEVLMQEAGVYHGPVNGRFGPGFKSAVEALAKQRKASL